MDVSRNGDLLLIRMYPGEEIISSLIEACRMERASTGVVLSSIGQLKDFALGYYTGRGNYEPREFVEPHELISISGMINRISEDYEAHLHACLGDRSKSTVGGHLIKGTVVITNETVLLLNGARVDRINNQETDLRDLKLL
jgi:predicted DNA-binding protein with PD1-like motif